MATPDAVDTAGASKTDVLDSVLGIDKDHPLYAIRHEREKVVQAMQKNYDMFFDASFEGIAQQDRLLIAWYASSLSNSEILKNHYQSKLADLGVSQVELNNWFSDNDLTTVSDEKLRVILLFTQKLILEPGLSDEAEIKLLLAAGITSEEIVFLAQLIAFLSYQIRVVLGLLAIKERLAK